ncbi:MAG: hypothetical protein EXS05_05560 [Planctomycetaceae bacterium]|nr:hypothetical protein [Planctomycetaceae bacterium]
MSDDRFDRKPRQSCRFSVTAAAAGLIGCLIWPGLFWPGLSQALQGAKGKKGTETEKIIGKVTAIEKKGKSITLTVEKEGDQTLPVLLTPKLKVAVNGKGDVSFLRAKTWVSSQSVVKVNNALFGYRFMVHLGNAPPVQLRPDPGSADVYHLCGQVVSADDESVTLSFGNAAKTQKVMFEEGRLLEITVSSNDLDLIVEGSEIEMEGITRGTKFTPQRATVKLEKPLQADEVFGADKDGRKAAKSKSAGTAKGGKKSDKGKQDEPAGGEVVDPADPFGELSKDKKGAKPAAKQKPTDAKGVENEALGNSTDGKKPTSQE